MQASKTTEYARPFIDGKSVSDASLLREIQDTKQAAKSLRLESSIGIDGFLDEGQLETWYMYESGCANNHLAGHFVVPWTNPVGRMARTYKRSLERGEAVGEIPLVIEGRTGNYERFRVGPLVDYEYIGMEPVDRRFWSSLTLKDQDVSSQSSQFRSIISTLDLQQDDQICGPMTGVFSLTGGPGVGKTTVALHRIPYLINEQFADKKRPGAYHHRNPSNTFFTEDNQLIVVWKKHLVPYLRECVQELQVGFPSEGVKHIDKWMIDTLRDYLNIGSKGWRMSSGIPQLEALKESFGEGNLEDYLNSDHEYFVKVKDTLVANLPKAFQLPQRGSQIGTVRQKTSYRFEAGSLEFSMSGVEFQMQKHLDQFPEGQSLKEFSENEQRAIRNAREQTRNAYAKVSTHLTKYDELLFKFYSSKFATDLLAEEDENFDEANYLLAIEYQRKGKTLTPNDKCLLLWLVHLITYSTKSTVKERRSLTRYSHVLIDEAQYYDARLLRLFKDLVDHSDTSGKVGVVTIVGDVEQRISTTGGVTSLDELDLKIPDEAITRLDTNYRWTPEVFEFIRIVHEALGVEKSLQEPHLLRHPFLISG